MITGKQEYIERRIAMLEAQLAELNKYGDDIYSNGTVLRFKKRFDGRGGQWYTFAALKASGSWYLTGASSVSGPLTWDELGSFITSRGGDVKGLKVATGWANV